MNSPLRHAGLLTYILKNKDQLYTTTLDTIHDMKKLLGEVEALKATSIEEIDLIEGLIRRYRFMGVVCVPIRLSTQQISGRINRMNIHFISGSRDDSFVNLERLGLPKEEAQRLLNQAERYHVHLRQVVEFERTLPQKSQMVDQAQLELENFFIELAQNGPNVLTISDVTEMVGFESMVEYTPTGGTVKLEGDPNSRIFKMRHGNILRLRRQCPHHIEVIPPEEDADPLWL